MPLHSPGALVKRSSVFIVHRGYTSKRIHGVISILPARPQRPVACEKAAGARCFKTDARIVVIGLALSRVSGFWTPSRQ